jgi:hypothetical protein
MTNYYLEQTWRNKTDAELIEAAIHLNSYYEDARLMIHTELTRRGLPNPNPTTGETPETSDKRMLNIALLTLGLIGILLPIYAFAGRHSHPSVYSAVGLALCAVAYRIYLFSS